MPLYKTVTSTIGRTPLIKLNCLSNGQDTTIIETTSGNTGTALADEARQAVS